MTETRAAQRRIRRLEHEDLESILAWRNHESVRRYMFTRHEIGMDEHLGWFERVSRDPRYHLLVFEEDACPLGFASLYLTATRTVAEWGFYVAPGSPKGTGFQLGSHVLAHAFEALGLHKVCGQVLQSNLPSIKFHQRLRFQQEGILRDQHFDGQTHHDIVCFGLLNDEWQANSER